MDRYEFAAFVERATLDERRINLADRLFNIMDTDGSGKLEKGEVRLLWLLH